MKVGSCLRGSAEARQRQYKTANINVLKYKVQLYLRCKYNCSQGLTRPRVRATHKKNGFCFASERDRQLQFPPTLVGRGGQGH